MKVVFRVDASLKIGTGHVMRCLTLGNKLRENEVCVEFICRKHDGNLIEMLTINGFKVHVLAAPKLVRSEFFNKLEHSEWLGANQRNDAKECVKFLEVEKVDWLIVDHYGIDEEWQYFLKNYYEKLMVIDDLADRKHICDLLLDQTYCRKIEDYKSLVPSDCLMLVGSRYALLRPEFAKWRAFSIMRRRNPEFKKLLITMGGIDKDNITQKVLVELKDCNLSSDMKITVIVGEMSPHLETIERKIKSLPFDVEVKSNVTNMAELMSNSDAAIGASGATTWERCCLGLPSIQIITAKNQNIIGGYMSKSGAALTLEIGQLNQLKKKICSLKKQINYIISKSLNVTDGAGSDEILRYIK